MSTPSSPQDAPVPRPSGMPLGGYPQDAVAQGTSMGEVSVAGPQDSVAERYAVLVEVVDHQTRQVQWSVRRFAHRRGEPVGRGAARKRAWELARDTPGAGRASVTVFEVTPDSFVAHVGGDAASDVVRTTVIRELPNP